jgi:hypothetical protein
MFWWAVLGACWIWMASGPEGLGTTFAMGGLAVLAFATLKFLDFINSPKNRRNRPQEMRIWKPREIELSAFARRRRFQK